MFLKRVARCRMRDASPQRAVLAGLAFLLVFADGRIIGREDLVYSFKRKLGLVDCKGLKILLT